MQEVLNYNKLLVQNDGMFKRMQPEYDKFIYTIIMGGGLGNQVFVSSYTRCDFCFTKNYLYITNLF